ncbi:TolC family protein [Clostridium saccharoperbutylacetonicum]
MKKKIISVLIMTLIVSSNVALLNAYSVQAATTDTSTNSNDKIKVSLENIRDIMTENNLDIKMKSNESKIANETYHDARDAFETKSSERDSAKTALDTAKASGDTTAISIAQSAYDTAQSNYESAEKALDSARDALKTARDNYNSNVETQIYNAQTAYITYLNDLATQNIKEDTVTQNKRNEEIYKLQYENGFISKNKYTELVQANTSVNDLNSGNDTLELDKVKLCNLLGISSEDDVTFETDITKDFEVISKIKYEDDLNTMLGNNVDIQNQNDTINDLEDEDNDSDSHDYEVENAKMKLTKLTNDAETDFKGQYDQLMSSYNSLKNTYDVINQKQNEYEITKTKYDYGFVSKNDVDAAKLSLDTDTATFVNNRNKCYLNYLKYIEMKEGY